jgi:hypothetical protein
VSDEPWEPGNVDSVRRIGRCGTGFRFGLMLQAGPQIAEQRGHRAVGMHPAAACPCPGDDEPWHLRAKGRMLSGDWLPRSAEIN